MSNDDTTCEEPDPCASVSSGDACCGPENPLRSVDGDCPAFRSPIALTPNLTVQECIDSCSAEGASVVTFKTTNNDCVCVGVVRCQAYAPQGDPDPGVMRGYYNICTGARLSAELPWHASLMCVMSFSVSE